MQRWMILRAVGRFIWCCDEWSSELVVSQGICTCICIKAILLRLVPRSLCACYHSIYRTKQPLGFEGLYRGIVIRLSLNAVAETTLP